MTAARLSAAIPVAPWRHAAAALLALAHLAGCSSGGGGDGQQQNPPDTSAPEVSASSPQDGDLDVLTAAPVTVTFSEAMDPASVVSAFTLEDDGGAVAGTVTWDEATRTATFSPDAPLAASTLHTATVGTGARDLAQNPLAVAYAFQFTTVGVPEIVGTYPGDGDVDTWTPDDVIVYFGADMDPDSLAQAFTLTKEGGAAMSGTTSYTPPGELATFRFDPDTDLDPFTTYVAVVTTAATSAGGVPIASAYSFSFTTGARPQRTLTVYNDPNSAWMNMFGRVVDDLGKIDCGGTVSACVATYDVGTTVTLTAYPAPAADFLGWTGDDGGGAMTTTLTLTLDVGRSCAASFYPDYGRTVTVSATVGSWIGRVYDDTNYLYATDPRKLDCGTGSMLPAEVCSYAFTGDRITLRADPAAGHPAGTITWTCTGDDLRDPQVEPTVTRTGVSVPLWLTRDKSCHAELVP